MAGKQQRLGKLSKVAVLLVLVIVKASFVPLLGQADPQPKGHVDEKSCTQRLCTDGRIGGKIDSLFPAGPIVSKPFTLILIPSRTVRHPHPWMLAAFQVAGQAS